MAVGTVNLISGSKLSLWSPNPLCASLALHTAKKENRNSLAISAGARFLEDFIEYIILPAMALASKNILSQQEEMADMLFKLLGAQEKWLLIYQILNKCAQALIASSRHLPPPLQNPLQALLLPPDVVLVKARS